MSNTTRSLKRNQDRKFGQLTPEQKRLPSGRNLTEPVKGKFVTLPLVASIAMRDRENIPLVMLCVALLDAEQSLRGSLQIELPVYKETESATVRHLERYGWRGAAWSPGDLGWPTGSDTEEQTKGLLTLANLAATLVFPPNTETHSAALEIEVTRANGSFLMPPLDDTEAPEQVHIDALRGLIADYKRFYPSTRT